MKPASRVMPMLSVKNMREALAFYRGVLGGEQVYQFPPEGEPGFLTLRFGETELGIGLLSDKPAAIASSFASMSRTSMRRLLRSRRSAPGL